jgi:hypothetical protein
MIIPSPDRLFTESISRNQGPPVAKAAGGKPAGGVRSLRTCGGGGLAILAVVAVTVVCFGIVDFHRRSASRSTLRRRLLPGDEARVFYDRIRSLGSMPRFSSGSRRRPLTPEKPARIKLTRRLEDIEAVESVLSLRRPRIRGVEGDLDVFPDPMPRMRRPHGCATKSWRRYYAGTSSPGRKGDGPVCPVRAILYAS